MKTPTFKDPLVENLVNVTFKTPEERRLLMLGRNQLPTSKEDLHLTKMLREHLQSQLESVQKEIRNMDLLIATAEVIFAYTGAEGDALVDFHENESEFDETSFQRIDHDE